MDIFGEKYDLSVGNDKVDYVRDLMEYLNLITNSVELDVYVNILSKQTGVSTQALYMQLDKSSVNVQRQNISADNHISEKTKTSGVKFKSTQQMLLSVLIYNKDVYLDKKDELSEDMFDGVCQKVYKKLSEIHIGEKAFDVNSFISGFDGSETSEITKILSLESDYDDTRKAALRNSIK